MDPIHHSTLITETVAARLKVVARDMRTGGVTGAVDLALRAFRGRMLAAVYDAFPKTRSSADEPKQRLAVTLEQGLIDEIDRTSSASGVKKMCVVGILLTAHEADLEKLIAAARRGVKGGTDGSTVI